MTFDDLPHPQKRALDLVREVSAEKGCRPYLVGGPVRDLLLGRHAIDLDLTLEEGSSTLARALAKRLEGRVRSFPQFMTYKVVSDGFPEIDIATARRERYRKPGALPAVEPGRLEHDLARRDFSINAIAVDVMDGTQHDPTGGEQDLRDHVIRVLHDRSFEDDPTRIFRALRLATRLGFTIDPHTSALMRAAIEASALENVSKERIWRELFMAMDEIQAPAVLAAFGERGALEVLFGARAAADFERLRVAQREIAAHPDLDRYVLYTATLLYGNASPVDLEGSGMSQKRARNVVQIANELPRFRDALAEATSDRQRFRLLKTASPEMLSVVAANGNDERQQVERFQEYQSFKLPLRGNDLELPGGPHVAKALERTREAVFTGEIDVEQARSFARDLALKYLNELRIEN